MVNMEPDTIITEKHYKEHTGDHKRNSTKQTILSRFPPPQDDKPLKSDCEPFDFDVHEKIQFFERRNKAVESVKKSIADYVSRSIEGLLGYSTRETKSESSRIDEQIKLYLLTGTPIPRTNESNDTVTLMELLYKDLKENRSNKLLRKFVRTLTYKVKEKTDCSREVLESISPVIHDVILGIVAKKMLSHKIDEMLGFQKDVEDRGEEVFTMKDYKIKFGWKIGKRRIKTNIGRTGDTEKIVAGQECSVVEEGMTAKRKRRRSRRKKSAAPQKAPESELLPQMSSEKCEQERFQESVDELIERKLNISPKFNREPATASAKEPDQASSETSQCNLEFMDASEVLAIKMEDQEMSKINRVLQRKSGKTDRRVRKVKLKESPVSKWETQLMSSSFKESALKQSIGFLRQNELKVRKKERSRKKRETVNCQLDEKVNEE